MSPGLDLGLRLASTNPADVLRDLAILEARVSLVLIAGLATALLAGRRSAATRTRVVAVAAILALALPCAAWLLPAGTSAALAPRLASVLGTEGVAVSPPAEIAVARGTSSPGAVDVADPMPSGPGTWALALGLAWILGTCVLLARLARGWWRAGRLVRRSIPAPHRIASRPHLMPAAGRVRMSGDIASAVTAGALRPVILLPPDAAAWSEAKLDAVLAHEADHVARRDALLQLPCDLLVALHWWNPLAWTVLRALRSWRERAADDAAVRAGVRPSALASELIAGARSAHRHGALVLAFGAASDLPRRVERLVAPGFRPGGSGGFACVFGAALVVVVAVAASPERAASAPGAEFGTEESAASGLGLVAAVDATAADPDADMTLKIGGVDLDVAANEGTNRGVRAAKAAMETLLPATPRSATVIVMDVPGDRLVARLEHGDAAQAGPLSARRESLGSVVKPLVALLALEAKVVATSDVLDCGKGPVAFGDGTIQDVDPVGRCTLADIIARSSNVGAARVGERLGASALRDGLVRLGVGASLPDGAWSAHEQALAASGAGVRVTPVELARAYHLVARAARGEDTTLDRTAALQALELMTGAVEKGTGRAARVEGHRVAGKTGTARLSPEGTLASFAGVVPANEPRWVVLVVAETLDGGYTGGTVAAPAFKAAAEVLLKP